MSKTEAHFLQFFDITGREITLNLRAFLLWPWSEQVNNIVDTLPDKVISHASLWGGTATVGATVGDKHLFHLIYIRPVPSNLFQFGLCLVNSGLIELVFLFLPVVRLDVVFTVRQ